MNTNNGITEPSSATKLSDVPDYQQVYIPKSTYRHVITDVEYGLSKAKNPMFTLKVEIAKHPGFPNPRNPSEVIDPNGTEASYWLSLTPKAMGNIKKFHKACGLPLDITLDDLLASKNPEYLRGKEFLAIGYSEASAQIDEISQQPIKNPLTGQDIIYYRYKVGDVFAAS